MRQKGDAGIAAGWLQNPEPGQGYEKDLMKVKVTENEGILIIKWV